MKLLILGATGGTGQHLITQSLAQQHEVTVLVRDPSKPGMNNEKIKVIKGDVLDKDVLVKALEGNDAVLSALGCGKSLKSNNLISNAMNILIPAMLATGVKRLVFESAFGVGDSFKQANFIQKFFFRVFLKNIFTDKAKAEEQLRNSTLDWTMVYPVVLTDGALTGKYKAGEKLLMKGMPKISRADVAEFMLLQLADNTYLKKAPIIMS